MNYIDLYKKILRSDAPEEHKATVAELLADAEKTEPALHWEYMCNDSSHTTQYRGYYVTLTHSRKHREGILTIQREGFKLTLNLEKLEYIPIDERVISTINGLCHV